VSSLGCHADQIATSVVGQMSVAGRRLCTIAVIFD